MSKEMSVILLGLLVVVTPYLGIPGSWKTIVYILVGVVLAGVGFLLRGEALARGEAHGSKHFVENAPAQVSAQRDHGIGPLN